MGASGIRFRAEGAEPAPELVLGAEGGDLALSSFWKDGPAVLIFLRHFG